MQPLSDLEPEHRRRVLRVVTWAWMLGSIWVVLIIPGAPLNEFAQRLGATSFHMGLIAAIPALASLCAVPASLLIDASGDRKGIFLKFLLAQRFLTIPLALVPLLLVDIDNPTASPAALWTFMFILLVMWSFQAIGGPAWVSWMADLVPGRIRGRYFARRRQWGILTAIPAILLAGAAIDAVEKTNDPRAMVYVCCVIFLVIAIPGILDIAIFKVVPHHRLHTNPNASWRDRLLTPLRDRQFVLYSLNGGLIHLTYLPLVMFSIEFLRQQLDAQAWTVQLALIALPQLAILLCIRRWGRMVDRSGVRPLLIIASVGMIPVSLAWVFVGKSTLWLAFMLPAIAAMLWAAVEVANFTLMLRSSGSSGATGKPGAITAGGSGFSAANTVIFSLCGVAGGWIAGASLSAMQHHDFSLVLPLLNATIGPYETLFLMITLVRAAASLLLLTLERR